MAVSQKIQRRWAHIGMHAFLIPFTLLWLVPIIMMIAISVRPASEAYGGGLWVSHPTFKNYVDVWTSNNLLVYFKNSLIITGGSVLLVMLLASACAYAISIIRFKGSSTFFLMMLLTMMLPVPAIVVPLVQIIKNLGLLNNYMGLIGPYVALGIPFATVIMKNTFDNFPKGIEEAARIDGCSDWMIFWRIVLPLNKPALAVIAIWQFMTSWNEFILAMLVMTEVPIKPLILVPIIYNGIYLAYPGHLFAILGVVTIPIIVFYLALQRNFISGLTAGALKG
ncbi:MAG: carbohydrate ABC transporter permease [Firmicutes bacterium]|nr:carbohydrate ABC transporter permease [Bacillota bacterium]